MKDSISIKLQSEESYSVKIASDLEFLLSSEKLPDAEFAFLIIDENVEYFHGERVFSALNKYYQSVLKYVVPSGESSKSVEQWVRLTNFLLENQVKRNTPVFVVGGGVTGDLGGFVAASVLRGLPLYHIPTTILAMVDSAIGGKTGINHTTGKNLIGAFYQPKAVLMDTKMLATLPEKEWKCGLGEVLKYACISDKTIFDEVDALFSDGLPEISERLSALLLRCAQVKAEIVMEDEKESGIRAFLNFGHTFAHALEAFTAYKEYAHGEAVYIGMIAAMYASKKMGYAVEVNDLLRFKYLYNFSPAGHSKHIEDIVTYMYSDKKNRDKNIRLILLSELENPVLVEAENTALLKESFEFAFEQLAI